MTKPREKTREELQAEIEDGKKKIRQLENREKIIKQKLSVEERKARNHRLCKRGGFRNGPSACLRDQTQCFSSDSLSSKTILLYNARIRADDAT